MAEKEATPAVRRDPFAEFDLFDRWSPFRDLARGSRLARLLDESRAGFAPAVDIAENDDAFVVTVELPGAKKDDVGVEVHENVLTIRGEKRNEREEEKEHRRLVERSYGSFSRSFTLPSNTDADRVSAAFQSGILTVEIPKIEEAKPKTIAVKG